MKDLGEINIWGEPDEKQQDVNKDALDKSKHEIEKHGRSQVR